MEEPSVRESRHMEPWGQTRVKPHCPNCTSNPIPLSTINLRDSPFFQIVNYVRSIRLIYDSRERVSWFGLSRQLLMRHYRKRFTISRVRSTEARDRALKTRRYRTGEDGRDESAPLSSYRNSPAGRALKAEHLAEQWQRQDGTCPVCWTRMRLDDCRFKMIRWDRDLNPVNPVVHKRCWKSAQNAHNAAGPGAGPSTNPQEEECAG